MHVRFWGTRGSLPKPGQHTLRFGGNTACVEVESSAGTLIVIDGGTGLHALGQALVSSGNCRSGHLLISHTHWDHIQGIPFFAPFFGQDSRWQIYAPKGFGSSIEDTLAGQMQYAYFPIRLDQMGARITFAELVEGTFDIADVRIRTQYMNHTALTLGFRLEADGASVVYASDHEPYFAHLASGRDPLSGRDRSHAEFAKNADLLIHDAQFTAEEYSGRIGWGHSPMEYAAAVARSARTPLLALTHHDPQRTDAELAALIDKLNEAQPADSPVTSIFAAQEGQLIKLGRPAAERPKMEAVSMANSSALIKPSLVLGTDNRCDVSIISEAAKADGIPLVQGCGAAQAIAVAKAASPAVMILDAQDIDTLWRCTNIGPHRMELDVPTIVIAESDHESVDVTAKLSGSIDVLVRPFSAAYARSLIRAALLRTACRWQRSMTALNEQERLEEILRLSILDTEPEERFDRITRLAASLFGAPMALISLVDRDRQWFKSKVGLGVSETSREVSFCAHAVAARNPLIVSDAFQDARFADNPLVIGAPRIRFYAGYPLYVKSQCVGTLCILDTKPREITAESIRFLRDLAAVAEIELVTTSK